MTKKLTKVAMTTALAAAAIVPAVVATPAQAAEAEVTFAKAYYTTANGTAAFEAGKLGSVISTTKDTNVTYVEGSNGEVFDMKTFSAYFAANKTATTNEVLTALSKAGKALSADQVKALNVKEGKVEGGKVTVDADAPVGDVKVESVKAINKTTVEVKFSNEIDTVTAANFKIAGANVTAATLAADKKTVTLSVSGLAYATEYAVKANNILIDGTTKDFEAKTFTTPAVTDIWELQITTKDSSLVADGADNTEVTFKLVDKVNGEVDKDADNIVLDLNTTYGTLAQKRVTVQDGIATVLLTSEFSNVDISAKIDAQIIEASGDYKDLINHVFGTALVPFKTTTTENVETLTLVAAEANQADRMTLFFDKEVSLKHFVDTNNQGELLYVNGTTKNQVAKNLEKVSPTLISHQLINDNNVKVTQGGNTNFKIKGFKPVAGNSKALEVILDKTTVLKDNASVKIDVVTVNSLKKETNSSAEFKVTDARKPEATSVRVEGLNTLKVKFSEAIYDSTLQIDGQFKGIKKVAGQVINVIDPVNKQESFTYEFGEFNPVTLVDNRDLATVELTGNYLEAGDNKLAGYFGQGQHTVQISSTEDFAALTDRNNVGTTQNLTFNIAADSAKPTATVSVESPEQFRVKFDKQLSVDNEAAFKKLFTDGKAKLQYLDADGEYKDVENRKKADGTTNYYTNQTDFKDGFTFTKVSASEYLIELKKDWTEYYDTNVTNKNYYNDKYRIVIAKDAVTNVANGQKNDEIKLDLNYSGSPLNSPDTTSPVISTIERIGSTSNFNVTMSEPVKLKGKVAEETKAQGQTELPVTTVQFLGKDKNGAAVTVNGTVVGYADTVQKGGNGADKVLEVQWDTADTPQTIVDAGGSQNWTVVIRSISDDVGNTAASATKDFTVEKSPAGISPFFVDVYASGAKAGKHKVEGKGNGTGKDTIEITFSEGVQFTGSSDATNPANYTLNGVTLPVGTSISVENDNGATYATAAGLEKVVITLPDGTLNIGANVSNVITVNKNLVSYDGSKIQGPTEVIVNVEENNTLAAQAAAVNVISQAGGTANTITVAQLNTATGLSTAIAGNETAYQAAIQAKSATTDLDTPAKIAQLVADVNTAQAAATDLQTAKAAVENASYTGLTITGGTNGSDADKKAAVETIVNNLTLPTGVTATVNADGSEVTLAKAGATSIVVATNATFTSSVYTDLGDFTTAATAGANGEVFNLDVSGLNGQTLTLPTGNAIVINLTGDLAGGAFTVNTPSATVNNSATNANITITDVSSSTWNENAQGNKIVFNDGDAGTNFVVGAGATVASLTVKGPAVVTNNGTVTELVVGEEATGATISNTGKIETLTANVDVIFEGKAAITTNGTGTVAASPAELLLKKAELAKSYKYDPVYTYSYTDLTIANTQATITYDKNKVTADPKLVMNDMARYLGALYRVDNGATITALDYKGKEYTWNGTLKGSNWKNGFTTLVSVITADFVANQDSFNTVTLQLKDAKGNTTDLTLKVVLTGN